MIVDLLKPAKEPKVFCVFLSLLLLEQLREMQEYRCQKARKLIRDSSIGDTCPMGSQLRPHIVWFGEHVPFFDRATDIVSESDIFICIGTSLQVFPASALVRLAPQHAQRIIVNPELPELRGTDGGEHIEMTACTGVPFLVKRFLEETLHQDSS